ncbi:G-protein coupled receptor 35-like [Rhinichthys klamathensis goyatoka]|uniref:G-protein coupled receptor 35-like n=1 Tax=Rhinichthys klamathensis goyatoka TaxID=3034132 RepID=UPI0024B4C8E7|nr:G-protein coupled receptor 35-like [Rhinichthys klamathensis goyatoka]
MKESSTNSTTDSYELITRICVSSISFLFGLPTHSYVLWLIITEASGVASVFLKLNFSLCEIGVCLKSLFILLSIQFSCFKTLSLILQGLFITGRPLFQCLICVERYLAVVHPVTFLKYKPLRYRVICSTTVWIITCGSCLFCWLILKSLITRLYTWFFSLQFLLFLSIQLFCLVAVLRALKQSGPGERGRTKEEKNSIKRKAFQLILISTVSLAVIYVPFIMSGFTAIFTQQHFPALWATSVFCYILGGFIQPVLFLNHVGKLTLFSTKPVKEIHCNVNNVK